MRAAMLRVQWSAIASLMVAVWAALANSVPSSGEPRRGQGVVQLIFGLLPQLLYGCRRVRDEVRHLPAAVRAEGPAAYVRVLKPERV
jgi:hypothetical protein